MPIDDTGRDSNFIATIERTIGRTLTADETQLALTLEGEKSPEVIARELVAAPITDPKKIRPEHKDAADE